MNREDIIRMAREAGIGWGEKLGGMPDFLERFAALVASAERERLTDAAMKSAEKAIDVAMALEREACAKVCDDLDKMRGYSYADKCATAIRARGQA